MLKKQFFDSMNSLNVLPFDTWEELSAAEPFVKFRTAEKGFVRICEDFKAYY